MPPIFQAFRNASARGIGRGGRRSQIIHTGFAGPDHPVLPQLAEWLVSRRWLSGWMDEEPLRALPLAGASRLSQR